MSCWLTVYVLSNPEIRAQVQKEVVGIIESSTASAEDSLSTRIAQVPLEAWDSELPFLEKCIRETLRLNLVGSAPRKNVGKEDIVMGTDQNGKSKLILYTIVRLSRRSPSHAEYVVRPGEYAVHLPSLVHLDEKLYPDPMKYECDFVCAQYDIDMLC